VTAYEISPAQGAGAKLAHPVELIGFALVVVNVVALLAFYAQGSWIVPLANGAGNVADFVTFWAAGREILAGHAGAVYDWPTLKAVEEGIVGPFHGYLGWAYPPTFLFVAAALALLPYTTAFVVWVCSTFLAYLVAIRAIIGDRVGYFLAAAFPAVLANCMVGQNAFLSAGFIGGALALVESRPLCAGALLGLLAYKPHLGLLFPIALVMGGRWRVIAGAAITVAVMAAASALAFGGETWRAFFAGISPALSFDGAAWGKLQSAFGLVRALGGSEALAWSLHVVVALTAAVAVGVVWRSRAAYEIKAAALGTAVLLATPHLLAYDLVILAVPLAFLFRLGRTGGFLKHELAGIGLACLLILIYPFVVAPVGFAAALVIAALVLRRAVSGNQTSSANKTEAAV
jgi:arabinofuranan 3-O-arabinosyltransferase